MSIRAIRNLAFLWLVVAVIVVGRSATVEAVSCGWTPGCHVIACESDEMGGLGCAGTCSGSPGCDDAWLFCNGACGLGAEFFSCNECCRVGQAVAAIGLRRSAHVPGVPQGHG